MAQRSREEEEEGLVPSREPEGPAVRGGAESSTWAAGGLLGLLVP